MPAKANVNYTPEMTAAMLSDYAAGVPTEVIAEKVGRTLRSVIAKLSREGVYKKAEYKNKNGESVVKKDSLADELAMLVGLTEAESDSLTKANKTALAKLLDAVKAAKLDKNQVM